MTRNESTRELRRKIRNGCKVFLRKGWLVYYVRAIRDNNGVQEAEVVTGWIETRGWHIWIACQCIRDETIDPD